MNDQIRQQTKEVVEQHAKETVELRYQTIYQDFQGLNTKIDQHVAGRPLTDDALLNKVEESVTDKMRALGEHLQQGSGAQSLPANLPIRELRQRLDTLTEESRIAQIQASSDKVMLYGLDSGSWRDRQFSLNHYLYNSIVDVSLFPEAVHVALMDGSTHPFYAQIPRQPDGSLAPVAILKFVDCNTRRTFLKIANTQQFWHGKKKVAIRIKPPRFTEMMNRVINFARRQIQWALQDVTTVNIVWKERAIYVDDARFIYDVDENLVLDEHYRQDPRLVQIRDVLARGDDLEVQINFYDFQGEEAEAEEEAEEDADRDDDQAQHHPLSPNQ
jgi:hypothetical protein